jgi:hypothetical protein
MEEGIWLSILEYSNFRGISVSTIRRYIKCSRVKFKKIDGKYLIFVSKERYDARPKADEVRLDDSKYKEVINDLKNQLRVLKEENEDLKMLVHLYEFKNNNEEAANQFSSNKKNYNENRSQI